jgi:ACT domain-containing protein
MSLLERQRNQYQQVNELYVNKLNSLDLACGKVGISKATYYRLKNKFKNQKGGKSKINIYNDINESDNDIGEDAKELIKRIRETTKD